MLKMLRSSTARVMQGEPWRPCMELAVCGIANPAAVKYSRGSL